MTDTTTNTTATKQTPMESLMASLKKYTPYVLGGAVVVGVAYYAWTLYNKEDESKKNGENAMD